MARSRSHTEGSRLVIQAMVMVLDFAPEHWNAGTRLVALALADRVNGDTHECWPSIADLSRRTGLKERQVQRYLRQLEDEGVIVRLGQRVHDGRRTSNVWVWKLLTKLSPSEGWGVIQDTRGGVIQDTPVEPSGVSYKTPKPLSRTTIKNPIIVTLKSVNN